VNIINKMINEMINEEISTRLKKQKTPGKKRWKQLSNSDRIRILELYDFIATELTRKFTASLDDIPESAGGSDIRFSFNYEVDGEVKSLSKEEVLSYLIQLLAKDKKYDDLVVTIIPSGINFTDIKLSGSFPTFMISKPYATVKSGEFLFFITHTKENKSGDKKLTNKQLTPEYFDINGKSFTYDSLYKDIMHKLKTKKLDSDVRAFIIEIMNIINDSNNYTNIEDNIIIKRTKLHKQLNLGLADQSIIYKNFGEIIQPLVITKNKDNEIMFPSSASEQLVDFYIDDVPYSTKYKSGAPPSIKKMARVYYQQAIDTLGENHVLVNLFKTLNKRPKFTAGYVPIYFAINNMPDIMSNLLKFMEVDSLYTQKNPHVPINKKIVEYYNKDILEEKLIKFYTNAKLNVRPVDFKNYINNSIYLHSSDAWGLISYPIRVKVINALNNDFGDVKNELVKLINANSNIIQVRTYDTENELKFLFEHFNEDIKIDFVPGGSFKEPNNQNIRIKISKA